jgi:hypothetical protein
VPKRSIKLKKTWQAKTRAELVIEVWEHLDCESVGGRELKAIQEALGENFGAGGVMSPAAIARVVADEGAVLRHPEVFEFDFAWRQESLTSRDVFSFSDLDAAFASFVKLESVRLEGTKEVVELREIVMAARDEVALQARSKLLKADQRDQLHEIASWLSVWLQSPELFSDWLDLRRRSPEFVKKFRVGKGKDLM